MGVIADMIRAGIDPEIIERVHDELVEASRAQQPMKTARQERNARYYEARKERLKGSETVLDKTVKTDSDDANPLAYKDNHARADGNPCSTSLRSVEIITPLPTEGPQGGRSRSRGTALPDDWQPSAALFDYAAKQGLSRFQAESTFEDLRIWAAANRNRPIARKADWDSTAKGFIRREVKEIRNRLAKGTAPPGQKRFGFQRILADELKRNFFDDDSKTCDHENVLVLPVSDGGGPRDGGGDGGELPRNPFAILVGRS